MVTRQFWSLLALPLLVGCSGSEPKSGNAASPIDAQLSGKPGYANATVTTNGGWGNDVSGDETRQSCAAFRVTTADVNEYFNSAGPVDSAAFNHDLDQSRCFAAGTVRKGGQLLRWTLDRAGRGQLIEADNRRRYFQCAHCPTPPFEEGAGKSDPE